MAALIEKLFLHFKSFRQTSSRDFVINPASAFDGNAIHGKLSFWAEYFFPILASKSSKNINLFLLR